MHVVPYALAAAVAAVQEAVTAALEYLRAAATSLTRSQRILKKVVTLQPSREQVERIRFALERAGDAIQSLLGLVRDESGEPAPTASEDALAVAGRWPTRAA